MLKICEFVPHDINDAATGELLITCYGDAKLATEIVKRFNTHNVLVKDASKSVELEVELENYKANNSHLTLSDVKAKARLDGAALANSMLQQYADLTSETLKRGH